MECPGCDSGRLKEDEKTGNVYCETCGYEMEEPEKSKFREKLHEGHKEKKHKW